jgi:hypothetical protein
MTSIHDVSNSFRDPLIKMGLLDDSAASRAVYQGILALSCLLVYGQSEGRYFYHEGLSALTASIKVETGRVKGMQHLAASMLLTVYEVRAPIAHEA